MFNRQDVEPGRVIKYYATVSSDLNLKTIGGMGEPARQIIAGVAGNVVIVNDADSTQVTVKLGANVPLTGYFREIKTSGTTASEVIVKW